MLDTSTTLVRGSGTINLANETLDIVLKPEPKDRSILSLRSPIEITGSFKSPIAGPDKGALAGRAGVALALGAINPLLALLATMEPGPGENANCAQVLAAGQQQAGQPRWPKPAGCAGRSGVGRAANAAGGIARHPHRVPFHRCARPASAAGPSAVDPRALSSFSASAACMVPMMPTSGANTPMVAQRASSNFASGGNRQA